jgi:hypothetical protein
MALLHVLLLAAAERMILPRPLKETGFASSSLFLAGFSPHLQEPPQELMMILFTYPSP